MIVSQAVESLKWRSWVGSQRDIQRLVDLVEAARAKHPKAADLKVIGELAEGARNRRYDASIVVERIDPRRLSEFTLLLEFHGGAPAGAPLVLKFRQKFRYGVEIVIDSDDEDWAVLWREKLRDEVSRGVKWWGSFRSPVGLVLIAVSSFVATYFLAAAVVGMLTALASGINVGALAFAMVPPALFAVPRFNRWLLPPFELSDNGSSGTRRTVTLVLAIVEFLLAVVVNLITS